MSDSFWNISIVKSTRYTVSHIYFGTTLYVFRAVSPSIIRSLRLYIQHQVYVIQVLWLFETVKIICIQSVPEEILVL